MANYLKEEEDKEGMKYLMLPVMLILLLSACAPKETSVDKQEAYKKCTSVCSSVLTEDFTTLHLCNEQCKKEFGVEEKN